MAGLKLSVIEEEEIEVAAQHNSSEQEIDPQSMLTVDQQKRLQDANYKLVGPHKHAAVKLCHWTKESVKSGGESHCYKQTFYGINSHQCVQMTPDLPACNLRCSYCWRDFRYFKNEMKGEIDKPESIVEETVKAQRNLLTGLGGTPHNDKFLEEAKHPRHVAISLDGEPTLYPHLPDLIKHYQEHGMTTFLVTNGTNPEALRALVEKNALPTQLYVSLSAVDEKMFLATQHPTAENMWPRILETLSLLPKLNTRRVIRLTMVKGLNMEQAEKYAQLISKTNVDFIEIKGWSAVGQSRQRMPLTRMPTHEEIKSFSQEVLKGLNNISERSEPIGISGTNGTAPKYKLEAEQEVSRVVLLMRNDTKRFLDL